MSKASGGSGIPAELFQLLKDDTDKVLHSICYQICKTQQWPPDWKRSVFTPISQKVNAKEYSNYCTIVLLSHASKSMLKILQARFQQDMNPRMSRRPSWILKRQKNQRSHCQHLLDHGKSKGVWERNIYFYFIACTKDLTVWITTNCGKYLKRWITALSWRCV